MVPGTLVIVVTWAQVHDLPDMYALSPRAQQLTIIDQNL